MTPLTLFCLPYAGGNKYSYRCFEKEMPSDLKMITLEYPGRGTRINESLVTDINLLADDIVNQIENYFPSSRYALYGHSMGGLIVYLASIKIVKKGILPPVHLIITGTCAPSSLSRDGKKRHLLGKKDFVDELIKLKGSPTEVLQNPELLDYFEPILRADFQASENYLYEITGPLNIPLLIITGTEETMQEDEIISWKNETTASTEFIKLPGDHFFILQVPEKVISIISTNLVKAQTLDQPIWNR